MPNWQAVAVAVTTRMEELGITQRELAERTGVSAATLRQIQNNYGPRRRSPRTLSAISTGLRWPAEHLKAVLDDDVAAVEAVPNEGPLRDHVTQLERQLQALEDRVLSLERRLPSK